MIKEDEIFKKIFRSIDVEIEPNDGTKQRIYERLFYDSNQWDNSKLSCLSLVPKKLLKLLIQLWVLIYIFMSILTPTIAL